MSGVWERFEERVAAEDARTNYVRAYELFSGLVALDEADRDSELRRCLGREPRRVIESLYVMLIELTGGPEGRPGSLPDEQRLWSMRAAASARVSQLRPAEEQLSEQDLAAAQRCTQADQHVASAVPPIATGDFTEEHVQALRDALDEYRAAIVDFALSSGGGRLLGWKAANALNWLARAAAASGRVEESEGLFTESAHEYSAAGDRVAALASQQKAFELLQARIPDADERLRRLSEALDGLAPGTLEHVQALVGMAALEADHGDLYAARQRVKAICGELHEMRLDAPKSSAVDAAVVGWIGAIPRPDPPQPNFFLRIFTTVVQLHAELARTRMACRPEHSVRWQPILDRCATIAMELPDHTELVHERLSDAVSVFPVPAWVRAQWPAAPSGKGPEYLAMLAELNALMETFNDPPPDAEGKATRLMRAEQLVARARAYGKPVPLSQALWLYAAVCDGDGRHAEAVAPLQEASSVVSIEGGADERDAAITALTALCKVYAMLGEHEQISRTAGEAIEAIERDRYRINAPFLQSAFLSAYKDVFTLGVYSALELGDYPTMLARAELSKARSSVLRLMRHDERSRDAVVRLDGELRLLSATIRLNEGAGERGQLAALRERRQRLWNLRAIGAGELAAAPAAPDLRAVQAAIGGSEAVVYYYWLRPTVLLMATLTAEEIEVERRSLSAEQRANLERFVRVLATLKGTHYTLDSAFIAPLADALLPDKGRRLLEGKRRLAISPHRLLHWFPFHAAPWEGTPLIRTFAVRYVPNLASLLLESPEARDPFVLELAVSEFPGRTSLGELKFVTAQSQEIASEYRERSVAVSLELEPSRDRVAALLAEGSFARATTVHAATHGKSASADTPMDSVLQLADGPVDGLEISSWPLERCELVTLSACEAGQLAITGRGMDELPGDEMFGLPAAFLEAGARSVLASVWPAVEDSGEIMVSFHRHVSAGVATDFALQAAQCEYLDAQASAPARAYFWAGVFLLSLGTPAGGAQQLIPTIDHRSRPCLS